MEGASDRERLARIALGVPAHGDLVTLVRALLERDVVDPAVLAIAIDHLRAAEDDLRVTASAASGAGEGLAAVVARRTLELARAFLLCGAAPDDARSLHEVIAADPSAEPVLRSELAKLRARLGA